MHCGRFLINDEDCPKALEPYLGELVAPNYLTFFGWMLDEAAWQARFWEGQSRPLRGVATRQGQEQ